MNKKNIPILLALLVFTLACSLFTGDATITKDSPAAPSNILFQDDFSNTGSGWDRNDWEEGKTDYENGTYHLAAKTASYDIWANPGQYFEGDVIVEADATKIGGENDDDYGLICRYSGEPSSPNYYFFIISSDGYAVIGKASADSTTYISSEQMQPTKAIKQGNSTNQLRADCIGSALTLYVNGQQVATATDADYTSGDIGLIAGTFDISYAEVAFDNLVVSKP